MLGAKRIDTWPDFNGQPATSYGRDDGRRYVLFGEDVAEPSVHEIPSSRLRRTRIGYQVFGEKAVLLGILVSESNRGKAQGEHLIEYFLDNVGEHEGEFAGTSRIHKPVVSLQLARVGLRAEQDDFRALLLPRSNYDESPNIPKITVLEDEVADRRRVVKDVDSNVFYKEVHPVTAKYKFPSGGHEILLHTTFVD
jgi:hypothetical protein